MKNKHRIYKFASLKPGKGDGWDLHVKLAEDNRPIRSDQKRVHENITVASLVRFYRLAAKRRLGSVSYQCIQYVDFPRLRKIFHF